MADPISVLVASTAAINATAVAVGEFTTAITALSAKIAAAVAAIIGVASVIAKYLPKPEDGTKMAKVYKYINMMAQNSGHAENKIS